MTKIAEALDTLSENPSEPSFAAKAKVVVSEVANQIGQWWQKHAAEAVDWSIRMPAMAGTLALFHGVGANMWWATPIAAQMTGGDKITSLLRKMLLWGKSSKNGEDG